MPEQAIIEISGAGPAGLSAALAAAHAGRAVRVHERRDEVGRRFHGDFQGFENWTTEGDVLDELAGMGIEPAFDHTPFYEVKCSPRAAAVTGSGRRGHCSTWSGAAGNRAAWMSP